MMMIVCIIFTDGCNAMLAMVLAVVRCLCLSVCMSASSQSSVKVLQVLIEVNFGTEASFDLSLC